MGLAAWLIIVRSRPALAYFAREGRSLSLFLSRISLVVRRERARGGRGARRRGRVLRGRGRALAGAPAGGARHAGVDALEQAPLLDRTDESRLSQGRTSARASRARARGRDPPPPPPPLLPSPPFRLAPRRAARAARSRKSAHAAPSFSRRTLSSYVERLIRPCRLAFFLNIWSSIFTAAFFAYVQPQSDFDIEELLLYFIRLFSDLLGRPLARMVRPSWAREPNQLVWIACGRLSLMAVFFLYIAGGLGPARVFIRSSQPGDVSSSSARRASSRSRRATSRCSRTSTPRGGRDQGRAGVRGHAHEHGVPDRDLHVVVAGVAVSSLNVATAAQGGRRGERRGSTSARAAARGAGARPRGRDSAAHRARARARALSERAARVSSHAAGASRAGCGPPTRARPKSGACAQA